mgnify:CR=1 FL=1
MNRFQFKFKPIHAFIFLLSVFIYSCTLPKELQLSDRLKPAEKFYKVDEHVQKETSLPEWRTFFKDPYLIALIDTALHHNQDLKMASQRMLQNQAALQYHTRKFYPSVNASLAYGLRRFGEYTIDGVGNFDTNLSPNIRPEQRMPVNLPDYFLGFESSWEIGVAGKLRKRRQAALNRYLASAEWKNYVQTQVVSGLARYYYELLAVDNELKIIRQNLAIQERAIEIVAIQKQSGQINELAVKQFQVQLLQTRALEADRKQHQVAVENALNSLAGRFSQHIPRADTLMNTQQLTQIQTGLPASLLNHRTDLREAMAQLNANEAELLAVRAAFYPSLNVNGFIALNGFNINYLFNPASLAFMGLAGLTAPLLNRNELNYQHQWQAAERNIAIYNYQRIWLESVAEVSSLFNSMQAYEQVSELKFNEVTELKQASSIANDLFLTGYANYLEVLMVRRNVLEAELQLTNARKEFLHSYIDLYKALGGGWN